MTAASQNKLVAVMDEKIFSFEITLCKNFVKKYLGKNELVRFSKISRFIKKTRRDL